MGRLLLWWLGYLQHEFPQVFADNFGVLKNAGQVVNQLTKLGIGVIRCDDLINPLCGNICQADIIAGIAQHMDRL